jgi:hypothetical protein
VIATTEEEVDAMDPGPEMDQAVAAVCGVDPSGFRPSTDIGDAVQAIKAYGYWIRAEKTPVGISRAILKFSLRNSRS